MSNQDSAETPFSYQLTYRDIAQWLDEGACDCELAKSITYRELKTACMCGQIRDNVHITDENLEEIFAFCLANQDYDIESGVNELVLKGAHGTRKIPVVMAGSLTARDGGVYYIPPVTHSSSGSGGSSGNNNNNNNNNNNG